MTAWGFTSDACAVSGNKAGIKQRPILKPSIG
jgi:hypothetical protein